MVFSSIEFILVFLPVFFITYYSVTDKLKNIILLIGSLAFYIAGAVKYPLHILVFILVIISDYSTARLIEKAKRKKKFFLFFGILINLANLVFYKYFPFIITETEKIFSNIDFSIDIILPIGISFYTFQGISYLADVYKGKIAAEKNFINFSVYIAMFEQLIAGPIVKYVDISDKLKQRKIKSEDVCNGFGTFIFGLGLKVLIANPLGNLWTDIKTIGYESISTPLAWMGIFAFSFQIYLDFFGYSVMAIGLGKMLGFKIPKNFDHPYLSKTMTEFWRRWHTTLGTWFREYVYIPLGGNRKDKCRTILNLLTVWLLTGIWHGAGYNFILWGLVTFLLIVSEKYLFGKAFHRYPIIGRLYMIVAIPVTWALFAVEDINQLCIFFSRLFPFIAESPFSVFRYDYLKYLEMYYPFLIAGLVFSTKLPYNILKRIKNKVIISIILCVIFAGSIYCIYKGYNDPFLYFRF